MKSIDPLRSLASRKSRIITQSLLSGNRASRFSQNFSSLRSSTDVLMSVSSGGGGGGEDDVETFITVEGNLANEVGLTVLNTFEAFCDHFKV